MLLPVAKESPMGSGEIHKKSQLKKRAGRESGFTQQTVFWLYGDESICYWQSSPYFKYSRLIKRRGDASHNTRIQAEDIN